MNVSQNYLFFLQQHKHKKKRKDSLEGNEDELIVDVHNEDGKLFDSISLSRMELFEWRLLSASLSIMLCFHLDARDLCGI